MHPNQTFPDDPQDQPGLTAAQLDARALVRRRRAALQRRKRTIRRSVAAIAVSMFLAVTGIIGVQMASGQDPALSASVVKAATKPVTAATASTSSSPSATTTASTVATTASSSSASASATPAAVTTSQS